MMPSARPITALIGSADQALGGFDPPRSSFANDRYTHLSVQQMRAGFKKLDAATPVRVSPGAPAAPAGYLKGRTAPAREEPSNVVPLPPDERPESGSDAP